MIATRQGVAELAGMGRTAVAHVHACGVEDGENLDAGMIRVGNWPPWHNTQRDIDLKKFFYDLETGFYARWMKALRAWGLKCPVITSNWSGAGNTTRLVIQASTIRDIVDRHQYFSGDRLVFEMTGQPGAVYYLVDKQ